MQQLWGPRQNLCSNSKPATMVNIGQEMVTETLQKPEPFWYYNKALRRSLLFWRSFRRRSSVYVGEFSQAKAADQSTSAGELG
jgi:hypothetical protein